ncbi:MAG: hypothetical protein LBV06_02345 [Propionibacteriaceae bacterium]|nr:hypothetical protein [Propionibacteriaceae bacterium]
MKWTSDVTLGDWIVENTSGELGAGVPDLVPTVFPRYARVFHPMQTSNPSDPDEPVTEARWSETAAACGTTMTALTQSATVRGLEPAWSQQDALGTDGRIYSDPEDGTLTQLAPLVRLLAQHTSTPQSAVAGIWNGWGGLTASEGQVWMRLESGHGPTAKLRNAIFTFRAELASRRKPGPGVLPVVVAQGPTLHLPGRDYFLARLSLDELMHDDWRDTVAWAGAGFTPGPALLWPDDQAWALATEIDLDSTIVGGSGELIEALVASEDIEALEIPADADLRW